MGANGAAALLSMDMTELAAVIDGRSTLSARHNAILSLWGSASQSARKSAARKMLSAKAATEWRFVPGFEKYQVNEVGQVRRFWPGAHAPSPRILKSRVCRDGYNRVSLYCNAGKMHAVHVHRIVALAFHGVPQAGMYACHKDGNKLNNQPGNIYWGTPLENARDTMRHRVPAVQVQTGAKSGQSITARAIRRLYKQKKISKINAMEMISTCNRV